MEGKMNVVVIMMLAFVGFAASGACVTDGVDTLSPNTVFSYEDTHSEVVGMNYLEIELKRIDHYDVVEMSWFSSWKGVGKGFVARTRLGSRGTDTIQSELGKDHKWRPFGRGRYVRESDFLYLIPKLTEKAAKWGAQQRATLREARVAQAKVNHYTHKYRHAVRIRKLVTIAKANNMRVMRVDVDGERRRVTTRNQVLQRGAWRVVEMAPPEGGDEDSPRDEWLDAETRSYHYHIPTDDDVDGLKVIEQEAKLDAVTAWEAYADVAGYAWDNIEDPLTEGIERMVGNDLGAARPNWSYNQNHHEWTHTMEHECYYLNKNGVDTAKIVAFIKDNIQAQFANNGVTVRVAIDQENFRVYDGDRDSYDRIDMVNITDDVSLGSTPRFVDWLTEEENIESVSADGGWNIHCMSMEINMKVDTLENQADQLKWYFDGLAKSAYPMATPEGFPPIVVGPKASNHHHVSPFGMGDASPRSARTKFNKLMERDYDDAERVALTTTVSTLLTNWVWNLELFEATMPYSRRSGRAMDGGIHFAAAMTNLEEHISIARAITEYAQAMGRETTPERVKDEYGGLLALWHDLYRFTGDSNEQPNVSESAFNNWDGGDEPPEQLAKLVRNSLRKWDKVLWHAVNHRARENTGDGGHYAGLNLHSLRTRGTIEFRQFGQSNNWKNVYQTMIQIQSLLAISAVGIPVKFTNNPHEPLVDSQGHFTGNGAMAMARLMCDTTDQIQSTKSFMDSRGITELADLNAEAIGDAHLKAMKGARSLSWLDRSDSDFVDDTDASVSAIGLGLASLAGVVATISPMVAAVALLVGCGISFAVNMNVVHKPGTPEDAADLQPLPFTKREVKGLLKTVPALARRGEQGFGIGKLNRDGSMTACWEVRNPPEKVFNTYGNKNTSYMKRDSTNIPVQRGALAMKALNGGYNLRREDYDGLVYIMHTRFSTGGTSDKLNAHPHYVGPALTDNIPLGIVGVHNGVIYNDREVMGNLPKDFLELIAPSLKGLDVDTRAIWACLALYGSDNDGIDMMANLVDGSMRLLWFDKSEKSDGYPPRLHCWSNTADLWFGWTKGPEGGRHNIVGASTPEILREIYGDALVRVEEAKLFHHYIVDYQHGLIDLGPCGVTQHSYGANDWQGGSSGKKNKPATTSKPNITTTPKTTNTKPSSVAKQLGVPGTFRQHISAPIDPNYEGDCAHCADGDLLYGSLEQCPECLLTVDEVMDEHYAKLDASCSTKSACSSPTKATPEAVEDLGLKSLFDDRNAGTSSRIPPVGSGGELQKFVAEANQEAAKKVVDKTKTNHPVDICAACNRPPETCDADPCVVETARRSRELGLSIMHEQKTKKSNPQALGYVVMRKCDDKLCCSMEQPHERTSHDDKGASVFECMGPCGWRPKPEAESEWQKEFADCACPTADDHDCAPVSPCEGSADYKANNLSQKLKDWIDNELAGGNTINITALSDEGQEYLRKRLSEGNLA